LEPEPCGRPVGHLAPQRLDDLFASRPLRIEVSKNLEVRRTRGDRSGNPKAFTLRINAPKVTSGAQTHPKLPAGRAKPQVVRVPFWYESRRGHEQKGSARSETRAAFGVGTLVATAPRHGQLPALASEIPLTLSPSGRGSAKS
jgi:hypothetical protein